MDLAFDLEEAGSKAASGRVSKYLIPQTILTQVAGYCGRILAALMTLAQVVISLRMRSAKASGVLPTRS
jgi:hypothetical protein